MIPVQQRIIASPYAKPPGDCFKCCIASILELAYEEVPHFVAGEWLIQPQHLSSCRYQNCAKHCPVFQGAVPYKADIYAALKNWLEVNGWSVVPHVFIYAKLKAELDLIPEEKRFQGLNPLQPQLFPRRGHPGYWIASVLSGGNTDWAHAVVMKGDRVAFDPSPHPRIEGLYEFISETWFVAHDPARCGPKL